MLIAEPNYPGIDSGATRFWRKNRGEGYDTLDTPGLKRGAWVR